MEVFIYDNLKSYDGVENLETFNEYEFQKYCEAKLHTCDKHCDFIEQKLIPMLGKELEICEIGSGNSKLLYNLENRIKNKVKILREVGLEISKSRFRFAEKFKEYMHSKAVTNFCRNFLDINTINDLGKFDIVIGVDIVLQIIVPLYKNAQTDFLLNVNKILKKDGYLLLELCDYFNEIQAIKNSRNYEITTWQEFDLTDPYKYVLSKITLDKMENLIWNKTFLKRTEIKEGKMVNIIHSYTPEQIKILLMKNGFEVQIFHFYNTPGDIDKNEFIILAKKIL